MKIINPELIHYFNGDLHGKKVERSCKLYKDAMSFYKSVDTSLDPDTVMYEVMTVNADKKEPGYLNWAISLLHPVKVNDECCMTRGHFHVVTDCEEYYWCAEGEGLLMFMDENGNDWCEKVCRNSLHHIDGHLAHRLINTGNTDLRIICCWNSNAGHDYRRVEAHPFPHRVFHREEGIVIEDA